MASLEETMKLLRSKYEKSAKIPAGIAEIGDDQLEAVTGGARISPPGETRTLFPDIECSTCHKKGGTYVVTGEWTYGFYCYMYCDFCKKEYNQLGVLPRD